ncbi:class II glutamine amidotransferase [Luteimicrobium subarcticum]|uniref:Glutamine amidotransferase n=1 Tax=Luteimicrobium subarcticum TaxID=620910 RepID=A0A2M8WRL5_9MICO|nr:class II glutamine amidotransferase [Luteimicrobium subarcticum]PJI93590.1 glutamine amidotransferase [Luteimicrobium subarcticum]
MCRLFALHAGPDPVPATFWLLDAPDSLAAQSHRNPDGAGIGAFDADGSPRVDKQPLAAYDDTDFATDARTLESTTFVAHVRYASTGALTPENTHPFVQDGRLFAHNGVVLGLDALDARLDELGAADLVHGDTDSERVFALVTAEIRRTGGDVGAGLTTALRWVAAELPVFALNVVLATRDDVWALRLPATHRLFVLERDGDVAQSPLDARSPRIRAHAPALAGERSVVVASEPMDGEDGWRALVPGELVRVDKDLRVTSSFPVPDGLTHLVTLADLGHHLGHHAASSQAPSGGAE